jgi:hypothetical protein
LVLLQCRPTEELFRATGRVATQKEGIVMLAEWGVGQVLWSMLWFTLFFLWIWLVISIFADIFRSDDMGGFAKVMWSIFVIFFPFLGVFVYIIARGGSMRDRAMRDAAKAEAAQRQYIQEVAGTSGGGTSTAAEIERLAGLKAQGVITEEEFQTAKAKVLAGS